MPSSHHECRNPLAPRQALPTIFERFKESVESNPASITDARPKKWFGLRVKPDKDPFGHLALSAGELFVAHGVEYIDEWPEAPLHAREKLEKVLDFAPIGSGSVAGIAEIAPLLLLRDRPENSTTPGEAADTARNSFDVLELMLKEGPLRAGYLRALYIDEVARNYVGIVRKGRLRRAELLNRHRLGANAHGPAIAPRNLAGSIDFAMQMIDAQEHPVTCAAHKVDQSQTAAPITYGLFEVIISHAREHIYPTYIPIAQKALERAGVIRA